MTKKNQGEPKKKEQRSGSYQRQRKEKMNYGLYVPMWQKNLVAAGRTNMWQCKIPFSFQFLFINSKSISYYLNTLI